MKIKLSNVKIKKEDIVHNDKYQGHEERKEINYDLEIECETKAEFLNFFNDPEVRKALNI